MLGAVVGIEEAAPVRGPDQMRKFLARPQIIVLIVIDRQIVGCAAAYPKCDREHQRDGKQTEKYSNGFVHGRIIRLETKKWTSILPALILNCVPHGFLPSPLRRWD